MRKWLLAAITLVLLGIWLGLQKQPKVQESIEVPKPSPKTGVIAENLEVPWALAFLPNGNLLVTQRKGEILLFSKDASHRQIVTNLNDVLVVGEGGLLGLASHPDFSQNNFIYVYYTYLNRGENTLNRVVRYKFIDGKLEQRQIIVDAIPGAINHNGGRIKFGPDNYLYITTGDAQNPSLAQDKNSLAGKILRVMDDGTTPKDNPFGNQVYSYGHRNPQGLAWDRSGQLWATEHGPAAKDELNKIEKGGNYGWPEITGDEKKEGMISPVIQSGSDTWAPAGLVYFEGFFYFAGLRGQALYQFDPNSGKLQENFKGQFGRLREVVVTPLNNLYITTSNKDGRGTPIRGDDKILSP